MNGELTEATPAWLGQPGGLLRRFLAFARSADQAVVPSGRQIAVDIGLAAAATVAALGMVVITRSPPRPVPARLLDPGLWMGWPSALSALPGVAARTAPLAVRRFRPLTAFWLCMAACLLAVQPGTTVVNFIALVPAAYSAVVHSRYRGAAMLSMPAAVFVLAFPDLALIQAGRYPTLLTTQLVFISVLFVGNAVRLWQRRASESQAQLLRLQAEHEQATRLAIGQERARIAGELHDVVTHNVSMMVVQAGAARRVLRGSPGEARSALVAIEECGRAAIVELQHLLGLLAPPGEREDASPAGTQGAEPLAPQPSLDRVRPLIDRVAAAGLPVELRIQGAPRALAPGLDLAAYRVVQEALTNVIKHAGQPRTTVTLDYRRGGLMIEIADDGRPGGLSRIGGAGRGLLGLRERVSLYGGELDAGRQPDGGWLVRARLPDLPPAAAEPCPVLS